jgi:pyruvate/2-oxoglutarate dehydrogenase complex dihydrolipoamide dehydrogenase (E3) component
LAQAFQRLGSEVTVLDIAQPLADHDPEAVEIVLAQLEREGVAVRSGVRIAHVDYIAHSVALTIESDNGQDMIEGSHLLIATGRKAAADGLGLDAAQIKHDATGIFVNSKLKTSNRRVYAIGGVVAGTTHTVQEAEQQADLVLRHALGHSSPRMTRNAMTRAVFTEPELAQVGLTEAAARRQRVKFRLLRWPYFENARAQAERAVHGHIKVICDNKGKILGVTIVGAQAGELIALWNLAMAQGVNIRVMASLLVPYPTLSEIGQRLAVSSFPPGLTRSWVRRIITWFRTFG